MNDDSGGAGVEVNEDLRTSILRLASAVRGNGTTMRTGAILFVSLLVL